MDKKQTRFRLSDSEAEYLGCDVNNSKRYRLSTEQIHRLQDLRCDNKVALSKQSSDSTTTDYNKPQTEHMSALVNGSVMNIDEYCEHYNLPREDVTSYKLVSHTGTPYYNIVFKERIGGAEDIDYASVFNSVIDNIDIPDFNFVDRDIRPSLINSAVRTVVTDVHIGMDTDKDGIAMYPTQWNRLEVERSAGDIVSHTVNRGDGCNTAIIDDLGDLLDGYNAQTVRGGHDLPQNMTNVEAFEAALSFKMRIARGLASKFNNVLFNNVCNDNHSGDFGYILNVAFKKLAEATFSNVSVQNHSSFMSHYYYGGHCFILSHGKDAKHKKFGFKPQLDSKQIEHIESYIKAHDLYREAQFIEFSKGDSHQFLFDWTTAQGFDYCNYPALSPASEWVQTNFKKGERGFVTMIVHPSNKNKEIHPFLYDE